MHDLLIVIGKTDGCKRNRGKHRNPDKWMAQVGPQQCRDHDADGNEQAAHGGRSSFFVMSLRTFCPDVLSDLKFLQTSNNNRAHDQTREQRSETRESRTESQITENAERRK